MSNNTEWQVEQIPDTENEGQPIPPQVFYDGYRYYLDNQKEYIPINEASTKRHLRNFGMERDEIEEALCNIQTKNFIGFAGPLAGKNRGIHETNGQKVLAINSPKIIQSKKGDFPNLKAIIEGLLGPDSVQVPIFYGWLKVARAGLLSGERSPGQVLALAGKAGCGKSLLIDLLDRLLGGRRANPYKFFTGRTGFNAELAGAELLAIDDDAGSTDIRARKALGAAIKANLFAGAVSIEGKYRTAFSFKPFWRMVMALNDEPEELLLLPPINDNDIADKITLFKCQHFNFPQRIETETEKAAFFNRMVSEMPGFLDFLEQWEIPEELKERRCGVIHYHEPSLMESLGSLSPEAALRGLIDQAKDYGSLRLPWEGTAAELKTILYACEVTRSDSEKLLGRWMQATGTYLTKLCGQGVEKLKLNCGNQRWYIS